MTTKLGRRWVRCFCAAAALLSVYARAESALAQGFTDITQASGLETLRAVRAADWWMSGLHLVDLDGDGKLDVFLSSHGSYGSLAALGDGTGKFVQATGDYPVSEIHIPYDTNEDGLLDLSMTHVDGGGRWWINASTAGALSFTGTDIERDGNTSRIQVVHDVDGDGKVDWIRASESEDGVIIDKGDGMGGFEQAASQFPGLGNVNPIAVDIDADGDKDWITSWGDYRYEPGQTNLYREDGQLELTDITELSGLYIDELALQGVGDFDHDGDSDFIAIEHETFPPSIFLNDGTGQFARLDGAISGVTGQPNYPTWGLGVVTDLDNDGIADLLFNGRNWLHVLRGTGGGKFEYMNQTYGIKNTAEASVDNGFAFGDVDQDGDLDVLGWREIYPDRYFSLYQNDLPQKHWIRVRPVGLAGNKGASGAKIRVYAAGTEQLLWYEEVGVYCRQVQPGYGYHFAETERHFGLGDRTSVDVTVEFYPSHKLVRQDGAPADTTVRIGEDGVGVIVMPQGGSGGGQGSAGAAGSAAGAPVAGTGMGGSATLPGAGGFTSGGVGQGDVPSAMPGAAPESDAGCGCRMKPTGSAAPLSLLGLLLVLRRRRG
jgi:MYXO-CTERM domain-containing protein